MRTSEVARMFGGSIAIYVVMAACSAASGPQSTSSNDSGGSSGSSSGAAGDGSGGILDALTDPVAEANADPTQSGTRLKASYYAGTDGSKAFAGMYDSMLNVACSFLTASDGTPRCLPVESPGAASSLGAYADAGCTQPLFGQHNGCAAAPEYGATPTASGACADAWHIFPISGPYTGASYYSGAPGSCSGPTPVSALTANYSLYLAGAELAAGTFVQATIQME